jgi:hypothetical protein
LLCEAVVNAYCGDKSDPALDPGCFTAAAPARALRFRCSESDCFGAEDNFGGPRAAAGGLSCRDFNYLTSRGEDVTRPFQAAASLRRLSYFHSWRDMQRNSDVCYRRECRCSHHHHRVASSH